MTEFLNLSAVTPWEAALQALELGEDAVPGTTFTVLAHNTGEVSKFVVDDSGNVVPVE